MFERPELARILERRVDLQADPISDAEENFVNLVILHLNASHYAFTQGLFKKPDGLGEDVRSFFSCPIPAAVWQKTRRFRDRKFAKFVEDHLE